LYGVAAFCAEEDQGDQRDRGDQVVERERRHRRAGENPEPGAESGSRQRSHREPAEDEVEEEVEIERYVCRQDEIENVVRIERQRVRVAGQRLAAAVREVPPGDFAGAKCDGGEHFDRVVRREVVAEKEEADPRDERAENSAQKQEKEPRSRSHWPAIIG
jgi:hypothetical protein